MTRARVRAGASPGCPFRPLLDVWQAGPFMLKILSWNMGHRAKAWQGLVHGDLGAGADVALLQEACRPTLPFGPADLTPAADTSWKTEGHVPATTFRTAIVRLSDRIELKPKGVARLGEHADGEVPSSRRGTLAVAEAVVKTTGETFMLASLYAYWDGFAVASRWKEPIQADTSVHRLISDLSSLIGHETDHSIIAAGDLNVLRGYGENGSAYWARRYRTVFDRMEAIGVPFVGPRLPDGERLVNRPSEMPTDSDTVPTFRTRQKDPASATRQLDFAFASGAIAKRVRVRALTDEWGPSDHCRLLIEVG